ncbi:non-ribosomal peptide synthetase [Nocardia sp. XZ_19_369]|uniref:non-ribosomal peptide synthetase n=1 Tax=Nocardia sp. XZ_19_369 TaxID=2769487 RepID=UPI00188EF0AB|nr:non-ribosomal peptide synthetase [Nocardia sp. XZ_19_369]
MTGHACQVTEVLREIWDDTLGCDVGDGDTVQALGGTSLHALQIMARIETALGVAVPAAEVFEREFAALADELARSAESIRQEEDGIAVLGREIAPLSAAQRRLWMAHQIDPGTADYNVGYAFRLAGPLDVEIFNRALDHLIARHRLLRVVIIDDHGEPTQRVQPARPARLVPEPTPAAALEAIVREEVRRPFDLTHGPLWRARLLAAADGTHVLVTTFHHVVTDHQTSQLLLSELADLYNRLTSGAVAHEIPDGPDYLDYAAWENTQAQADVQRHAEALEFWTAALDGATVRPFDLSPAAGPAGDTARVRVDMRADLMAGLAALGARCEASLFMVTLAAWEVLLFRMSGQRAGAVTVPVSGRTRPELLNMAGPLLNPLPYPAEVDPALRFVDLVGRLRDTAWGVVCHDLPVDELIAALPVGHAGAGQSLEAVKFTVEDGDPRTALHFDGLEVTALDIETGIGRFDLGVEITRLAHPERLVITLTWRHGRYSHSYATGLLYRYLALLSAVVERPEQHVAEFDVIGPLERPWLLGLGRGAPVGEIELVPQLVSCRAQATPDHLAVIDDQHRISCRDADQVAGRLAGWLREVGVTRGGRVALMLPPSAWYPLAVAGVWRCAAASVPLDPSWPEDRLRWVLDDSRATALVRLGAGPLSFWDGPQISMDALPSTSAEALPLSGLDPAYAIYTSGTTGRPKGVVVEHRSLANIVDWHRRRFSISPSDQVSQIFANTFDPSVLDTWSALAAGATLHVASDDHRHDAALLCSWLREQHITVAALPTGLAEALLALPDAHELALRSMLVGGDRLHWNATDSVSFEVVNVYGPTEATIWATSATVEPRTDHRPPPIGRPIDALSTYILDERMRLAPAGAVGELYIAGTGVALGYQGRPGLTAERFLPDPFAPGRMYRTGDLARWLPDGSIEFLGRGDDQVKIRGHRIELQEIEALLLAHPAVSQAVATVRDQRLIAYVVAEEVSDLSGYLHARLPSYLTPDAVVGIDAVPLTPNGKIDRKSLPEPPPARTESVAPRTPLEHALCAIWSELLPVDEIGVGDNFFELGGHSLLAIRAAVAVRARLGCDLSVHTLLANPTIEDLARRLGDAPAPVIQSVS